MSFGAFLSSGGYRNRFDCVHCRARLRFQRWLMVAQVVVGSFAFPFGGVAALFLVRDFSSLVTAFLVFLSGAFLASVLVPVLAAPLARLRVVD